MTGSPSLTSVGHASTTTGGSLTQTTFTNLSVCPVSEPSDTVRRNLKDCPSVPALFGAVKVAMAVFAFNSVSAGPDSCGQAYEAIAPSSSYESEPSMITTSPSCAGSGETDATATGARFPVAMLVTVILVVVVPLLLQPSIASWNVSRAPLGPTVGAENVGCAAVALLSVTAGPPVCVQE